jgi:NAD(P)-dependent dehydrogenase (short-subunit alcohol dehydrogenase family)
MDPALIPAAGGNTSWADLTGRVAVVTGGNGGIGLGMAAGLVHAGAAVSVWGTNPDKNAKAVERLEGGPGKVSSLVCDVSDEQAVVDAMARVAEEHGRLDACFANAGIGAITHRLLDTTLERFHRITSVDLDGAFVTMREAARQMVACGNGGSIVATSSVSVHFGTPANHAYAVSKAGLIAIVKGVAVEMARHGIRANALLPGWTETGMTEGTAFGNEKFVASTMPRMPVRRWGTAADFGAIAVYLASPASSFQTGSEILMDGGYAQF